MLVTLVEGYNPYYPRIFKGVKPGMVFVDVGAYTGDTIHKTLDTYPGIIIIGIEPVPQNYTKMYKKLSHIKEVIMFNMGCWDSSKRTQLYMNPGNDGGGSIKKQKHHIGNVIDVRLDTLDNILSEANIECVDLIKIDCENSEPETLRGFRKYKDGTQFHIECHDGNLRMVLFELIKMNVKELIIGVNYTQSSVSGILGSPPPIIGDNQNE